MTDKTVTYPADAVQRIADRLCDIDWNLPQQEAYDGALDIVLEVTAAVDKLRAQEAETVEVVPAVVTEEMIERAAAVLNAHRDSIELDKDLAETVLRAALEVGS